MYKYAQELLMWHIHFSPSLLSCLNSVRPHYKDPFFHTLIAQQLPQFVVANIHNQSSHLLQVQISTISMIPTLEYKANFSSLRKRLNPLEHLLLGWLRVSSEHKKEWCQLPSITPISLLITVVCWSFRYDRGYQESVAYRSGKISASSRQPFHGRW